jgi:hypothetical protein
LEFRVKGLGFEVQGSGFKVQGSRFKVQGYEFRDKGAPSTISIWPHQPPQRNQAPAYCCFDTIISGDAMTRRGRLLRHATAVTVPAAAAAVIRQ